MKPRFHSDPRPLLLSPNLAYSEAERLLVPYGFRNWKEADANLQLMAGEPRSRKLFAVILADLLHAVSVTADPDQALREWERYLDAGNARTQVFGFLAQVPHVLRLLCVLFGNSPAMAETLIRDPMLIYWIEQEHVLQDAPDFKRLQTVLDETLHLMHTSERKFNALRLFHRREMLRIGARDLFHVASVAETVQSLSRLAEIVIHAAYRLVHEELCKEYGIPFYQGPGASKISKGFVVLGMGKLGGGELNYSSDVDLIYLYSSGNRQIQTAKKPISHEMFFQIVAMELTRVLSASTSEGRLFRVDLRLRPEGDVGPLVWASCDAVKYYQTRGRTWERLALLKARPIAGHRYLGQTFLKKIRPFVMGQQERGTRDLVGTVHALRAQIHRRVEIKKEHERNVKFSPGGIRDIEFMVQTLQLLHAARHPQLFESNTMTGLQQLQALDLLQEADGKFLEDAYLFLRDVENKIQMVHELQTHTLPHQLTELTKCAVRMGYADTPSFSATSSFLARYESVRTRVLTIYERLLSSPS
ncbi:MAG: hypothetical protein F4142_10430 [Nitrospira sp. SB0675_bin_23]|nr:hypothetical protein [Nitrospira sp. SB0661_bin_20]MYH02960.1 hypothetical protein [Nitrospira sp. SB0675_bin_23]MYJ22200.1 hypothetical protein [Nitrospira sp. SB0673_bin_12]